MTIEPVYLPPLPPPQASGPPLSLAAHLPQPQLSCTGACSLWVLEMGPFHIIINKTGNGLCLKYDQKRLNFLVPVVKGGLIAKHSRCQSVPFLNGCDHASNLGPHLVSLLLEGDKYSSNNPYHPV